MTYQCKFGFGKCWYVRIAIGTVMSVGKWQKLPGCKISGRIKRELISALLDRIRESRAGCMLRRPYCIPNTYRDAASAVSWRWHAVKAMYPNSGDLAVPINMPPREVK